MAITPQPIRFSPLARLLAIAPVVGLTILLLYIAIPVAAVARILLRFVYQKLTDRYDPPPPPPADPAPVEPAAPLPGLSRQISLD